MVLLVLKRRRLSLVMCTIIGYCSANVEFNNLNEEVRVRRGTAHSPMMTPRVAFEKQGKLPRSCFTDSFAFESPSIKHFNEDDVSPQRVYKEHDRRCGNRSHLVGPVFANVRGGAIAKGKYATLDKGDLPIALNIPIKRKEFAQFIATSFLMFFFIIIFTMTRDTKDSLVVSNCGAESIPFLKLYGVMPAATIFLIVYSKLSNSLGKKALFYATLLPFFAFYTLFAFVLFPARDVIHFLPNPGQEIAGATTAAVNLIRYWSFSLYFIVTELYASAGVPLLFWQFANDVTSLEQAKRFYPLFAVIGNLAPIVSGKIMTTVIKRQTSNDDVAYGGTLKVLACVKLAVCGAIVLLHSIVRRMVINSKEAAGIQRASSKPVRKKASLRESFKELLKSRELGAMATMVLCYNVCIELSEVLWKGILRKNFTNKSEYMAFMGIFSQMVGTSAFLLQLLAPEIIRRLGWKGASLTTPYVMGSLALLFFTSVALGPDRIPLKTALLIGTCHNVVSKVTKYTLFDPCKEMAYIPLGPEAKVKGKAGVEVLGARLGRSVGSASQQMMVLVAGGTILRCAPTLGIMYILAIIVWAKAVKILSKCVDGTDKVGKEI